MPESIRLEAQGLSVPDHPIIPCIVGDGIGRDITPAMQRVVDAAVAAAYPGRRALSWLPVLAGEQAREQTGQYLPAQTLAALREHVVGIKGPLTTPVGAGIRSLNVAIRQLLDLYACIRPVRHYGAASPLRHPERLDVVIFRENTEDLYVGVEYQADSPEARRLIGVLRELGVGEDKIAAGSAIGIKPMSAARTKRHVRKALRWALTEHRSVVTLMHKGNIMKFTEGAFMRWGYETLSEPEFEGRFAQEKDLGASPAPAGQILVNDRIADNMFQQLLTRPDEYGVIVTPNLNGDYLSDAAAACVGGLGMAPGANIGDGHAVFEATHGSAPKYAGQDKVNPSSLILSGAMMLTYLGWTEAASRIHRALEKTLSEHKGTYDLARAWKSQGIEGIEPLSCSEFASALVDHL